MLVVQYLGKFCGQGVVAKTIHEFEASQKHLLLIEVDKVQLHLGIVVERIGGDLLRCGGPSCL